MRSLAPWLWLVDFDAQNMALDASESPSGELTAALRAHFAEVHVLRGESAQLAGVRIANDREGWAPASAALGSVGTASWTGETFDCIALHDALVQRRLQTPEILTELQGAHHLLKPGGWLALASPCTLRLRNPMAHATGIPRQVLSRLLRHASFHEIRCFFVEPSADDPCTVVPDVDAAIRARDTLEGLRGRARWKRRAALELGVQSILFPAYILLARA